MTSEAADPAIQDAWREAAQYAMGIESLFTTAQSMNAQGDEVAAQRVLNAAIREVDRSLAPQINTITCLAPDFRWTELVVVVRHLVQIKSLLTLEFLTKNEGCIKLHILLFGLINWLQPTIPSDEMNTEDNQ